MTQEKKILITGATGNVGEEVIYYLNKLNYKCEVIIAVRDVENAKKKLSKDYKLLYRPFDFKDQTTLKRLLRPLIYCSY